MDDDFFEIGGDSLQATEMLLELEETTRHRIAPSDVRAQLTIRHALRQPGQRRGGKARGCSPG